MPERRIATVLMLDVVGSTHIAAQLGDARYRELSSRFNRFVRASLKRFGGKEEDHAGDGFFATFPQPDRAIRCAAALAEEVRGMGIEIRAGIHTGQTEDQAGKTHGIAVVIGARVMSLADAGEILVTSTTKELATGSGFGFEDFSAHELKGVPGTWQVFAVTAVDGTQRARPLPAAEAAERRATIEPGAARERPRRTALIAAGSGLLLVIAAVTFAATRDDAKAPRANGDLSAPADAVVEVDPEGDPQIVRSIPIPVEQHGGPAIGPPAAAHPIAIGQGGVWTVRFRSLYHVDPARSEVRTRINLEAPISFSFEVVEGEDKIWVAFDGGLIEVNPATGEQRRATSFDSIAGTDVTVGGRFVWVGLGNGRLIRFDPRTDREVMRARLDPIDALAFGHGSVWTIDVVGETLSEYDPASIRPRARVAVNGGDGIVVGDSAIWVLSRTQGTITRIDPSTKESTGVVQVGPTPVGLAVGDGAIWVGDEDGVIRRVDEDTRQVTEIRFGAEIRGLVFDEETGHLWVDVV
jgi:class 3 adenylate cyclase/outer membrane protein assembly factor BamB